jgi:hypothetical protein
LQPPPGLIWIIQASLNAHGGLCDDAARSALGGMGQPAAAGVDQGNDLVAAGIDDSVVAAIGTTSDLRLLASPVFDAGAALFSPSIGVE